MRQILYGDHWIHSEEPEPIREIFIRKGTFTKFRPGTHLKHGGPLGDVTLITKGICLYQFEDWQDKPHILSLIVQNRVAGDIDAACCNVANVDAIAAPCGCEGYVLPYQLWHKEIFENPEILKLATPNIVRKQESHIEALLACFTMEIDMRLRSFFRSFIKAYYPINREDWNKMPLPLSTTLIARIVSASRTSVSLQLSKWYKDGFLKKEGNQVWIHGRAFQDLADWWV